MKEPFAVSLDLLTRMSRLRARAVVLAERARTARIYLKKSIQNTKAPVAAGAGKGEDRG